MMRNVWRAGLVCGVLILGGGDPASAQYLERQTVDRLDRLERDLSILQKQVYRGDDRGGVSVNSNTSDESLSPADRARVDVRVGELEEKIRQLTGRLEELQHGQHNLERQVKQLADDLDYQSQQGHTGVMTSPNIPPATTTMPPALAAPSVSAPSAGPPVAPSPLSAQPTQLDHRQEAGAGEPKSLRYDDATAMYNQAFSLLNQARYDEAAMALKEFTVSYPDDALIGNAFYWLGETYYVRRDYVEAADYFRQGYEKMPEGPKAPDNLLKLGMALSGLGKNEDACIVYGQLKQQFPDASRSVGYKLDQERSRIGCQ